MPDRRRPSTESTSTPASTSASTSGDENNPFAPPPEGRPDQPWQPRRPENGDEDTGDQSERPAWGSQWSPRQPGRSSGGFGSRPNGEQQGGGPGGKPGGDQQGPALRWDPTDPAQRRARYALLSGMWAFFFALFDFPEIALLLGALALYWGISSLRAKPAASPAAAASEGAAAPAAPGAPAGPAGARPGARPQRTAALSGLVTATLALAIVAATFTVQLVYRDYYTCVDDALTKTGQLSCNELLPTPLRDVFGVQE
ncbi:hypothetical protein [Streptomyces sp. NPDC003036]|uniref:hypothetical protein n=1 Tax=Streptomyces sp. NPDC003036 TaxID=3154442 RepID=UPI0033BF631B